MLNNITESSKFYKDVLHSDNMNVEAIACIGSNHFYSDQPEIALKFYRLAIPSTSAGWSVGYTGGWRVVIGMRCALCDILPDAISHIITAILLVKTMKPQ